MSEPQPLRCNMWHGHPAHDLKRAGRPCHAEERR